MKQNLDFKDRVLKYRKDRDYLILSAYRDFSNNVAVIRDYNDINKISELLVKAQKELNDRIDYLNREYTERTIEIVMTR